jgi:hypothetical protein
MQGALLSSRNLADAFDLRRSAAATTNHSEKNGMTYETKIGIEIEGIRRSIPLKIKYRVEAIKGKPQLIHDSVSILCGEERLPGECVYDLLGVRQRKGLEDQLLENWKSENGEARE